MSKNKKTILVVDDDFDFIEQMKLKLQSWGFNVVTGESQADGENLIKEMNPDLAIFDLMMENDDSGFILSYKMKQKKSDTPVILVTGVTADTGIKFAAKTEEEKSWVKADVVLNKEIRYEQLKKEIDKFLG